MLMLHRLFSDRVTVSYPDMGIDGDFFIEGHRIEVARGWTHRHARAAPSGRLANVTRHGCLSQSLVPTAIRFIADAPGHLKPRYTEKCRVLQAIDSNNPPYTMVPVLRSVLSLTHFW